MTHSGGIGGRPPKHGRFAFKSQGELAQANARWLEEIKHLDLGDHLAALAATAQRCITRCEELDTPSFRARAVELYREMLSGDEAKAARAQAALGDHLERGASEDQALRTLSGTLVEFGKRIEAAKHLDLQEKTTITQRQAEALIGGIMSIAVQFGEVGEELLKRLDRDVFRRNGIRIAG